MRPSANRDRHELLRAPLRPSSPRFPWRGRLWPRCVGVAAILVTHDQAEAFGIADRVAVMNGGRIEQVGSPAELAAAPRTEFVRDFLGAGL